MRGREQQRTFLAGLQRTNTRPTPGAFFCFTTLSMLNIYHESALGKVNSILFFNFLIFS